jgi:hypothetical protein
MKMMTAEITLSELHRCRERLRKKIVQKNTDRLKFYVDLFPLRQHRFEI